MKRVVLILLLIVIVVFYLLYIQAHKHMSDKTNPIRYVALGDSYTIGEGVNAEQFWPNILTRDLQNRGLDIELVANPSRTGWTTQDVLNYELPIYKKSKPDFTTLLIGVNDWVQGVSAEDFRRNFVTILNAMQEQLANPNRIIVITIPDFSVTPTGKLFANGRNISQGIAQFNRIIMEESAKKNLPVVDIFEVSKDMANNPNLIAPDGLHPSAAEYQVWEKLILPVAEKLLKK